MNNLKVLMVVTVMSLLVGCAGGMSPQIQNKVNALPNNDIVCSNGCNIEWERAEYWLNKHSKLKIQNITKNTIETYNPYQGKQFGFRLSKEPLGGGKYKINTSVIPYFNVGEMVSPEDARKMLNYYMRTGEDLAVDVGGIASSIR